MTYRIPDTLPTLRDWLRKHGASDFHTERQAAFMAQQLLGTRYKFPPKGESCFPVLLQMEKAVTENVISEKPFSSGTVSDISIVRSDRKVEGITPKAKRSKASRPKKPRLGITLATGFDTGLVIYCDGACEPNPGSGGWGFVVYRDGVEIHAESGGADPATNNTMELTGALMALRWLAEHHVNFCDEIGGAARLFCDSMYVVNGCNDWRLSWKARGWKRKGKNPEIENLALWRELDRLLTAVPIKLEWCKGHAGIIGNERADELSLVGRQALVDLKPDPAWYEGNGDDAALHDHRDTMRAQIEQQLRYEVY